MATPAPTLSSNIDGQTNGMKWHKAEGSAFLSTSQQFSINCTKFRPHTNNSKCRLLRAQLRCSASLVSRRQVAQFFAAIPLQFILQPCLADPGDEITFTKLPCEPAGCRAVEIYDYRVGTGRAADNGCRITIKWTGRLADRYGWPIQKEDAEEVSFLLGKDKLIRGFELAIDGMREGGKRRMIIPAELGYKDEQSGPLPASYGDRRRLFATVLNPRRFKRAGDLVIDVQLLKVRQPR